jgi:UDP-N-acetylmuramoyl-tripeptide--D-alanyl-D-alanine ligase
MNTLECSETKTTDMLKTEDIIEATGGAVIYGNARLFTGVCIDSRQIKEDELFVALKGERFDGHDFLAAALEKGSGAIVSLHAVKPVGEKTIFRVNNTLTALQEIARFMRFRKDVPVVAVTGSNGKTTTKELVASILAKKYRVLKNTGNLNNHIGLPLTLTKISDEDEVVVLEMGASGPGEIKKLCGIAAPDYGILTNISRAHLQGFKDIETIRKTKLELLNTVKTAVVNADDIFMMEGVHASGFKGLLIRYGIKNPADISAADIKLCDRGSSFMLHTAGDKSVAVNSKISGMFNIYNILAAASVGYLMNIDPTDLKDAIDSFAGVPMRLELKELNGIKVISDVYNANPASMEEAVKELVRIRKGRAIAVLGDMLELGPYEEEAHRKIGMLMSELPVDIFIAVGKRMAFAASEFKGEVYKLNTSAEAGRILKDIDKKGDTVLIKGSRGMNMEKVLEEYAL